MIRNRKLALLLLAVGAAWAASTPARAQEVTRPVIPIKPLHSPTDKPVKSRFQVLRMMTTAIQVQSIADEREIHTFVYSDQIRDQMRNLLDAGGYQYGDKVVIEYRPGTEVALKIKGKPSKPI
jgi:hypothetical protein